MVATYDRTPPDRLGLLRGLATDPAWAAPRRAAVTAVVLWALQAGWRAAGLPPPLTHNASPSVPVGWYVWAHAAPAAKGEIVELKHPPRFALGWLMKRVVGVAGDTYCYDPELGTQRLDGVPMPPPWPEAVAIGVPVWKGCVTLAEGQIVGYGDTPDSYDARYLGVTNESDLWGVYERVWP